MGRTSLRRAIRVLMVVGAAGSLWADKVNFNFEVRPILAEKCFACHGPDAKRREADLRLDVREAALEAKAIVPGDAGASELVKRLLSTEPDDVMPPTGSHKTASEAEKAVLQRWIEEGAIYEKHWAFVSPEKPPVPETGDPTSAPGSEVDAFVRSRLARRGWHPAAEASPEDWLRRVTLALTGLPPTVAEIDGFIESVARDSGAAMESVVDRLLASPAYGERMAVDWLDAARFADTYGRHEDADCETWPWRDWVIRAFNQNLPYDRFIAWQTAGDLLPRDGQDPLIATAFNRLHQQSNESGSNEDEFRWEHVFDRVKTNATAILGLTLECARCHDHKYDPFTQRDYYQFAAFFNNIDELGLFSRFSNGVPAPSAYVYKDGEEAGHQKWRARIEAAEERVAKKREAARGRFKEWLKSNAPPGMRRKPPEGWWARLFSAGDSRAEAAPTAPRWHFTFDDGDKSSRTIHDTADAKVKGRTRNAFTQVAGKQGKALTFRDDRDNQIMFDDLGHFRRVDPFTIGLWVRCPEQDHAVIFHHTRAGLDAAHRGYELTFEDGRLTFTMAHFYPGNALRIQAAEKVSFADWKHVAVTYDGSGRAAGMAIYYGGQPLACTVVRDRLSKDIEYLKKWGDLDDQKVADAEMKNVASLEVGGRYLDKTLVGGAVDELKIFDRHLSAPEMAVVAESTPGGGEDEWFDWYVREVDDECRQAAKSLTEARRGENSFVSDLQEVMVMTEMTGPRRPTPILGRGQFNQPGELVEPEAPAVIFPWPEGAPKDRAGLAQWLTDPRHPLTSRVAVNRYWRLLFGRGLVGTPEDFGIQGQLPTNPELLDWLAVWFVENKWDVKALCKMLVLSRTYRQSSTPADPATLADDPENLWLARGPRFRLPAEQVRDAALAVGGLLVPTIGGPSVKPYQPDRLWEDSGTQHTYDQSQGDALHRRSLYTFWRRTCPPPVMSVFDAPTREFCRVRRDETLTPLQGLALLNETGFVEASRVFAEHLVAENPGADQAGARVESAFRRVTAHSPSPRQRAALVALIEDARKHFAATPLDARKLIAGSGQAPRNDALDATEVAATFLMTRALFSADPFVCSY